MAQLQSSAVTGSLVVTGTITAQEFNTEFISSSILHESGSTSFGNSSDDVHNMTGSLIINRDPGAAQGNVMIIENKGDYGSSQDLIIRNTFDRDIGIKFEEGGGTYYQWMDGNGDDSMIFSAANTGSGDITMELFQNHNVGIPNGNLTVGGTVTATSFNGTVSLNFDDLGAKTSGTGDYSTTGHLIAGRASGGPALTINDGYGNANVTFNHTNGTPEQNGNSGRIEVNTDSTSSPTMDFELKANVTSGVAVQTDSILRLSDSGIIAYKELYIPQYIYHDGNTNTRIRFQANDINMQTNAENVFRINGNDTQKEIVVNEVGADYDFRVEGDTEANLIFANAGNDQVGIGTGTTQYRFNVHSGNTNVTSKFVSGDNQAWISVQDDDSGTYGALLGTDSDAGHDVVLAQSSAYKRLVISSTGNVGIWPSATDSTQAPATNAALHVSGSNDVLLVEGSGSTILDVQGSQGQLFSVTDDLTNTLFAASDISGVPVFLVSGSGESYFDGNLGIGTSNPAKPLHIQTNDAAYGSMRIYRDSTSQGEVSIGFFGKSNSSTNEAWVIGEGGWSNTNDFVIGNENSGAGGNVRLLIERGGNVGIGTTSPIMGLHVGDTKGAIFGPQSSGGASTYISPSDENTINGGYGLDTDTADIWLNYRGYQDGFTRFRDTRIGDGKGNAIFMVDGSESRVGIGTTVPAQKLDVQGASLLNGQVDVNDNNIIDAKSIRFTNQEGSTFGTVSGTLMFDENFYSDTEYGSTSIWNGNGGGLAIYNEDGWGRMITDANMQFLNAKFNSSTIETNPTDHSSTNWYSITDSHNIVRVKDSNELYMEKETSGAAYSYFTLHPEQVGENFDLSFRLSMGTPGTGYRHLAIAIGSDGTNTTTNYDYLVFRHRVDNTNLNQIRIDVAGSNEGSTISSNVPNFADGTERHVFITVRNNQYIIEVDGVVEHTITASARTSTSGQIGFAIYEAADANTHITVRDFEITHYGNDRNMLAPNVGIGTTNPGGALHVYNGTSERFLIDGDVKVAGATDLYITGASRRLVFSNGNGTIRTSTANNLVFETNGANERLTIKSNGNIAVGGTDFVDINRRSIYLDSFDSGGGAGIFFRDGFTYNCSITAEDHNGSSADGICISGYDGISFSTGANTKNEVVRITGGASNIGRVGIGTTSPLALLHIKGTGDAIRVESTNTGAGGAQMDLLHFTTSPADDDVHGVINFGGYYTGTSSAYGSAIKSVWRDVSARHGAIQFFTRDGGDFTEKMVITEVGRVGIGTSSPSVAYGAGMEIGNVSGGEYHGANSSAGGGTHLILRSVGDTARTAMSGPSIVFSTPANADGSNVWATSRILGSPSPAGSARGQLNLQVRDNYDPNSDGTSWNWRTALTIDNSGKVGIGTTNPSQKLTVDGTSGGAYIRISNAASGDISSGFMIYNGNNLDTQIYTNPTFGNTTFLTREALAIRAGGSQRMAILSNGNVGIGTTSPGNTLDVNGATDINGQLVVQHGGTTTAYIARFIGDSDGLQIKNINTGDYQIGNTQQDNAINFYDGTGGVEIEYNGSKRLEADSAGGVAVTGTLSATADVVAYSSDERLKENIKEIENPIDKIKQIKGVTFDWKDKVDELGFEPSTKKNDIGVIAQDIEKVLPQLIVPAPFDKALDEEGNRISKSGEDYKTVQYNRLSALLIEGIKEQQKQIEALKARIDELENK